MNTNLISNTKVNSLPYMPELTGLKTTRVITKHFINLSLYMHRQSYSLLTWLIYQSKSDNTVVYSTHLLNKFNESVNSANKTYTGSKEKYKCDIKVIRGIFKQLIEYGYLLPNYTKNIFTVNLMLSYHPEYMSAKDYKVFCAEYQDLENNNVGSGSLDMCIRIFTDRYSSVINAVIKKKVVK